jgi:tetratricopeptide (TPR) repeat protein
VSSGAEPSQDGEAEPRTAAEWLEAVRYAERRGELLAAFDLAERGIARHPDDVWLKHRAVLALARAGSTEEASRRFDEYGLAEIETEDIAALRARIAKDVALAADGEERRTHAARSAALYGAIFARTGGYYPGINAATLSMIAGDAERARALAEQVLELVRSDETGSYYGCATEAEAHLLLGRFEAAREALRRAAELHGGDYGAVATTRRQLRLVCDATCIDADVVDVLASPRVVHYCGHRISPEQAQGRFLAEAEDAVARRIAAEVRRHAAAYSYGSLASGADILWAEALIAQGAELHVVLPFARGEFVAASVAPAGPAWVERFDRCLAAASAVSYATEDAFLGDDELFRYGSELAMGLALLRAHYLDTEARQLAVWDGAPADGAAGTAIDVATWQRQDRPVTVISPNGLSESANAKTARRTSAPSTGRVVRALLFADVKGFSKLSDEQLPRFADRILGAFAAVLEAHGASVCYRNTWGDGVYVVLSDAASAAPCALDLQAAMDAIDLEAEALPPHLALRLAVHVGPVFRVEDPVVRAPSFMGSHVSRTARIEPVTPPGTVYVTEPFAAALVLAGREEFLCDYVGHMPAAKDFGRLRMYRLRHRTLLTDRLGL